MTGVTSKIGETMHVTRTLSADEIAFLNPLKKLFYLKSYPRFLPTRKRGGFWQDMFPFANLP